MAVLMGGPAVHRRCCDSQRHFPVFLIGRRGVGKIAVCLQAYGSSDPGGVILEV